MKTNTTSPQNSNLTGTDLVEHLFKKYEEHFISDYGYHNLLWQLIINKVRKNKKSALTANVTASGFEIGISDQNENGYTPTSATFKKGINMDDIDLYVEDLNQQIFNLSPREASDIVLSSMRK